jgi:hypothetical protein
VSVPWWSDGLAFECQRCRSCCRGAPGFVWVGPGEAAALGAHLGQGEAEFRAEFCREVGGRTSLRERADGDCALLGPAGCSAYPARPEQCRTFPFWPEHLVSPADWQQLGFVCPGVGRGPVHDPGEIRRQLERG